MHFTTIILKLRSFACIDSGLLAKHSSGLTAFLAIKVGNAKEVEDVRYSCTYSHDPDIHLTHTLLETSVCLITYIQGSRAKSRISIAGSKILAEPTSQGGEK